MATKSPGYETGLRVYCIIKKILVYNASIDLSKSYLIDATSVDVNSDVSIPIDSRNVITAIN